MEVISINSARTAAQSRNFSMPKQVLNKSTINTVNNDIFTKTNRTNVSFGSISDGEKLLLTAFPEYYFFKKEDYQKRLEFLEKKLPIIRREKYTIPIKQIDSRHSLSGKSAIEVFDLFKDGNYLSPELGPVILQGNLSFLDGVKSPQEKKKFVEYYREITGFPNLKTVSNNIKNEFQRAIEKTAGNLEASPFNTSLPWNMMISTIIGSGYDGISSVARNLALPGSDINNAYIILDGNKVKKQENLEISDGVLIKEFKSRLRGKTDHRILSLSRHNYSMPHVYTEHQMNWAANILKEIEENAFSPDPTKSKFIPLYAYLRLQGININYAHYNHIMNNFDNNYTKANAYFDKIAMQVLPEGGPSPFPTKDKMNRDDMFNFCMFLESFVKGDIFHQYEGSQEPWDGRITPYYINMSQINVFKNNKTSHQKDIDAPRRALQKEFDSWDIDKQYEFVKAMIKASAQQKHDFKDYIDGNTSGILYELKNSLGIKQDA